MLQIVVFLNPGSGAGEGSRQADQGRPSVPEWLFPCFVYTKSPGKEEAGQEERPKLWVLIWNFPPLQGPPGQEKLWTVTTEFQAFQRAQWGGRLSSPDPATEARDRLRWAGCNPLLTLPCSHCPTQGPAPSAHPTRRNSGLQTPAVMANRPALSRGSFGRRLGFGVGTPRLWFWFSSIPSLGLSVSPVK